MNAENIKYVLKHRTLIGDIAREHRDDAGKAWREARKAVRGIERVMDFDAFLLHAALLITLAKDAEAAAKEREELLQAETEARSRRLEDLEREKEEIAHELEKVLQDKADLEHRIEALESGLKRAREALGVQTQAEPAEEEAAKETPESEVPKKIEGWTTRKTREGYYRLDRKIRGRRHSLSIGREFDPEKARERIAQKERELQEAG